MHWLFKTLDKPTLKYFEECFLWYQDTPEILRVNWGFEDNVDNFIRDLKKGMNFLGFKDNIFIAMVHGEPKSQSTIEGHLFCLPETDLDFLTALVTFSKSEALKKYRNVVTQTIVRHKSMLEINYRAGFIDMGLRSWGQAPYRGRLLEIQHNLATK